MDKKTKKYTRRQFTKKIKSALGTGASLSLMTKSSTLLARSDDEIITPNILFLYMPGGWDTSLVFDPKVGITGIDQESGSEVISINDNMQYVSNSSRPSVDDFFADHFANSMIVNGIHTSYMDHERCQFQMLHNFIAETRTSVNYLTFYASNFDLGLCPHLSIDMPYSKTTNNYFHYAMDSQFINETLEASTSDHVLNNLSALSLSRTFLLGRLTEKLSATTAGSIDAQTMLKTTYGVSRLAPIKDKIVSLYSTSSSDSDFLKKIKFSIDMMALNECKVASIAQSDSLSWDTHLDSKARQSDLYETLFSDLIQTISYLKEKQLYSNTLIIVASEMGRCPAIASGNHGHWPYTSMLLHGPTIKPAVSIGLTDNKMRGVPTDPLFGEYLEAGSPLRIENIFAALLLKWGIPSSIIMPDVLPYSFMLGES